MSHWSKCAVKIDNLDLLESACKEVGLKCKRNRAAKGYGSQTMDAAMVISGKGMKYEIAVTGNEEDGYQLTTDYWGGSVEKSCGKAGQKLGQIFEMYSVHKIEKTCKKKRVKTKRIVQDDRTTVRVFA